jgi:glycogen debranching enzyme
VPDDPSVATDPVAGHGLQPLLHDLVSSVLAPTSVLSGADGQIRAAGVQGLFHADSRALSQVRMLVDGHEPEALGYAPTGPGGTRFVSLPRWLGDRGPDPTVRIDRTRQIIPGGMTERIEVASTAGETVTTVLTIELSCDFAPIEVVKAGGSTPPAAAVNGAPGELSWESSGIHVTAIGDAAHTDPGRPARLRWHLTLPPGARTTLRWSVKIDDPEAIVAPPGHAPAPHLAVDGQAPSGLVAAVMGPRAVGPGRAGVTADDHRIGRLFEQALDDVWSLRLTETGAPGDVFLGAGVPWFLTLFGRDSIWAARMLLPLGTELAGGTLRVLARRQGTRVDPVSGEAPGKIMHELRRAEASATAGLQRLPAAYYGTIDATPLWVSLLHDAWRWGLPEAEVAALLPHLEAALAWLGDHADPDGDGFVEYIHAGGRGLANQGWKDSGDAVRFRDGGIAKPPIALVEVQGYAYEAAMNGAALLEAFGRPGASRWRDHAAGLAERFRARFWVDGHGGRFPALALDRDKRPVDSLTSNIGHLLGTGLLSDEESATVAGLLAAPALAGGFGLRTMSADDGGYSPLSYHCGSIWAHDTAIVIAGLARAGFGAQAAGLAKGLLTAGETFGYRLPELFAGDARETVRRPVPYPAACRPQAWSAAAAVTIVHAAVGLYPDVPSGRVLLRPLADAPLGAISARGLRVAGAEVDVALARDGTVDVTGLPARLSVVPVTA